MNRLLGALLWQQRDVGDTRTKGNKKNKKPGLSLSDAQAGAAGRPLAEGPHVRPWHSPGHYGTPSAHPGSAAVAEVME